jgi:ubiquinone/menaquinone biosynthesis C-methylase UbiE
MTTGKTRDFFDAIATEWEEDLGNSPDSDDLPGLARLFPVAEKDVVLDAGCGTGRLLPLLRRAVGEEGAIVEMDLSGEMLKIGKRKRGGWRAHFVQADVQRIPVARGLFDAVVCFGLFPHIVDKRAALTEFRRVLKPGRPVVIAHLMGREELNALHSGFSGSVSHDTLPDEGAMRELFRSAGFKDAVIRDEYSLYFARASA